MRRTRIQSVLPIGLLLGHNTLFIYRLSRDVCVPLHSIGETSDVARALRGKKASEVRARDCEALFFNRSPVLSDPCIYYFSFRAGREESRGERRRMEKRS